MKDKRTILFLCDDPDVLGGLQRVLGTLIDAFRARGYHVVVTALQLSGGKGFVDPAVERHRLFSEGPLSRLIQKFKFGPLHLQGRRLLRLRWLAQRRARLFLRKQVETLRPIAVIAFDSLTAKLASESNLRDTKLLVQYHNSFDSLAGTSDLNRLRSASSGASSFLALTAADAEQFAMDGFSRVSYVSNPVSFFPARLPSHREQQVVALGRYHHQKAFDHLVTAWAKVPSREGWHLHIYGDGPERELINATVADLNIGDSVTVHGPTQDAQQVLSHASIYALSSRFEGLCMVALEAIACGVPIVTTASGPGTLEIAEGCGLICDIGDTTAFAAHLQTLIDDRTLREALGSAGRDKAQNYRVDAIVDRWERVIAESIAMPVTA
ncbi:glycosyltransferase (plasmid) [Sphingomonas sanguinis]|uniref:glycosyltransferase n=1 Tax=Sphingomonas sanguinis TaxID=33051 RepID=UPI001C57228D|nr:glycosyltransferase [Sphingomonas sanguinis]QXT37994.1 glycosyltransferase [Sphingomonas sanguinis]